MIPPLIFLSTYRVYYSLVKHSPVPYRLLTLCLFSIHIIQVSYMAGWAEVRDNVRSLGSVFNLCLNWNFLEYKTNISSKVDDYLNQNNGLASQESVYRINISSDCCMSMRNHISKLPHAVPSSFSKCCRSDLIKVARIPKWSSGAVFLRFLKLTED